MVIFLDVFAVGLVLSFRSYRSEKAMVGLHDEQEDVSYLTTFFILIGFTLLAFILGRYAGGL
jgi:hypothetical protein